MTQAMIGGPKSTIMCHDMVMIFIFLPLMVETRTTGPGSIKRYTSDKGNDCFAIGVISRKEFPAACGARLVFRQWERPQCRSQTPVSQRLYQRGGPAKSIGSDVERLGSTRRQVSICGVKNQY